MVFVLGAGGDVMEPRLRGIAHQIARRFSQEASEDLGRALDAGDRAAVERILRDASLDLQVRLVAWDLKGQSYGSGPGLAGALPQTTRDRVVRGETVVQRPGLRWTYAPLSRDGRVLGIVGISPSLRPPPGHLARLFMFLMGFFGIMALLTYPVARGMSRRLEHLTAGARRIAAGQLDTRVAAGGGDEIAVLGRAMNEMAEKLAALMRGQKELVAAVSHELRSPLARLKVSLEMAAEGSGGAAAQARHVAEIQADLEELEVLVNDLLLASRLELAEFPMSPEPIDLAELARQVSGRYPGVEIAVEGDARLRADGKLLGRVISNLVENGLKAQQAGGIAGPVTVTVRGHADRVEVLVRDHGPGVPPAERERIFEPFYRLDPSRSRESGGAGLGLAIARRIALRHGGTLTVGDALGGGALFALSVPRGT
ncbi:MAG: ATP-binding protein [Acidobacteriota bacterium]